MFRRRLQIVMSDAKCAICGPVQEEVSVADRWRRCPQGRSHRASEHPTSLRQHWDRGPRRRPSPGPFRTAAARVSEFVPHGVPGHKPRRCSRARLRAGTAPMPSACGRSMRRGTKTGIGSPGERADPGRPTAHTRSALTTEHRPRPGSRARCRPRSAARPHLAQTARCFCKVD